MEKSLEEISGMLTDTSIAYYLALSALKAKLGVYEFPGMPEIIDRMEKRYSALVQDALTIDEIERAAQERMARIHPPTIERLMGERAA